MGMIEARLSPWAQGNGSAEGAPHGPVEHTGDLLGVVDADGCEAQILGFARAPGDARLANLEECARAVASLLELPIETPTEVAEEFGRRLNRVGLGVWRLGLLKPPEGADDAAPADVPVAGQLQLPGQLDLPGRVVVGADGAYWRDFGEFYSMPPTSEGNDPVEVVAAYVREAAP